VHGILIADNWIHRWVRPSPLGRPAIKVDGTVMVVDRRFVDATVAAVKEYTSQHDLFKQCFVQLEAETAPPVILKEEGPSCHRPFMPSSSPRCSNSFGAWGTGD